LAHWDSKSSTTLKSSIGVSLVFEDFPTITALNGVFALGYEYGKSGASLLRYDVINSQFSTIVSNLTESLGLNQQIVDFQIDPIDESSGVFLGYTMGSYMMNYFIIETQLVQFSTPGNFLKVGYLPESYGGYTLNLYSNAIFEIWNFTSANILSTTKLSVFPFSGFVFPSTSNPSYFFALGMNNQGNNFASLCQVSLKQPNVVHNLHTNSSQFALDEGYVYTFFYGGQSIARYSYT